MQEFGFREDYPCPWRVLLEWRFKYESWTLPTFTLFTCVCAILEYSLFGFGEWLLFINQCWLNDARSSEFLSQRIINFSGIALEPLWHFSEMRTRSSRWSHVETLVSDNSRCLLCSQCVITLSLFILLSDCVLHAFSFGLCIYGLCCRLDRLSLLTWLSICLIVSRRVLVLESCWFHFASPIRRFCFHTIVIQLSPFASSSWGNFLRF